MANGSDQRRKAGTALLSAFGLQSSPEPEAESGGYLKDAELDNYNYETSHKTLVETWDGPKWSIQSSVNATSLNYLSVVSCTAGNACAAAAVGYSRKIEGGESSRWIYGKPKTLAIGWNGSEWSVQSTPNVSESGGSYLVDVSCSSATACMSVGKAHFYPAEEGEKREGFSQSWDGSKWSTVPIEGLLTNGEK